VPRDRQVAADERRYLARAERRSSSWRAGRDMWDSASLSVAATAATAVAAFQDGVVGRCV
jgi:hypothetical protein